MSRRVPILLASIILLQVFIFSSSGTASFAATGTCTQQTLPFSVTSASWGTASTPQSVYAGDQNVPLTVSLLFSGPCASPQTTFTLDLSSSGYPNDFAGPNGANPQVIALNIAANTIVTETFYLNVNQGVPSGTYYLPLDIQYTNNDASSVITQTITVPITLEDRVSLHVASTLSQVSGGSTDNVTLAVSNTGQGTAGSITTVVTASSSVTILNQMDNIPTLGPQSSAARFIDIFVPSSLDGTAVSMTFTIKYLDEYLNSQTTTQTLVFAVAAPGVQTPAAFVVASAQWSSTSASAEPLPGTQDATLVVNLQYLGSTPVTSLEGTVRLPAGVTDLNGHSTASAFSSATTNQYGSLTLAFNLNLASNVKPGNYNFTLNLSWMTSQSLGLTETTNVTPPPIASLQSSFLVEGSAWQKAATTNSTASSTSTSPVPGSTDVPLVINLQYIGTAPVTSLQGILSLPSGITDLNARTTATAFAATATPNQVVTLTFDLDVDSIVAPGSYPFTLNLTWTANSVSFSQTSSLTPPPVAAPTSTKVFQLIVTQSNSTVVVGHQTSAQFKLTNEGASTIYSPTFSLGVGSPLVVASIGSPIQTAELGPGASTTFTAYLTGGPSASPGIYSGTLALEFTDSDGVSHTQNFPVNFTLEGTVILILQDTSVAQSLSGFTVTGSILNEGSVAAYYASISGLFGTNSATPIYLGEIDPNTPLPFSVTIPYSAPITLATASTNSTSTASNATSVSVTRNRTGTFTGFTGPGNFTRAFNGTLTGGFPGLGSRTLVVNGTSSSGGSGSIALTLTYKDTFGNNQLQAFGVATTIKTASQLAGGGTTTIQRAASSTNYVEYLAYGVAGTVVVVLIIGAFLVRRHRAREMANIPGENRGDQSVI